MCEKNQLHESELKLFPKLKAFADEKLNVTQNLKS